MTELISAGVDWIHLDVMDGQFVPPITFGADLASALGKLGSTPIEAHLMTQTPEKHLDAFLDAGCKRFVFHLEATQHAHQLCRRVRSRGAEVGVAINPATPAESLFPLLGEIDMALVMTVNPGWGGQALIPACLDKVAAIRKADPNLDIEVDGGIDDRTMTDAIRAGANVFVTGSYLTRTPSIAEGVQRLRQVCGS